MSGQRDTHNVQPSGFVVNAAANCVTSSAPSQEQQPLPAQSADQHSRSGGQSPAEQVRCLRYTTPPSFSASTCSSSTTSSSLSRSPTTPNGTAGMPSGDAGGGSGGGGGGHPRNQHPQRPTSDDSRWVPQAHQTSSSSAIGSQRHGSGSQQGQSSSVPRPQLSGMSRVRQGRRYRLVVVQHPERARMCGFGDKDRRPLSPSLIVKLVISDENTGGEISPWEVNSSLFFLAADLCHPDDLMLAPRNLLVHQHAASVPSSMLVHGASGSESVSGTSASGLPISDPRSSQFEQPLTTRNPPPPPSITSSSNYDGSSFANPSFHSARPTSAGTEGFALQQPQQGLTTVTMEHYTRNLVGAAVTSANVLRDERDEYCIFFVLQDLSVRTEGVYRIRLVFTDLAQQDGDTNEGVSEALAEAYTDPFTVYSPRRFPGMLEPTELSKKLAAQGIKIAVRSDKKKRQRGSDPGLAGGMAGPSGSLGHGVAAEGAQDGNGEMDELDDEED